MQYSRKITVFHGQKVPEEGILVGYGAIMEAWQLEIPLPDRLSLISYKNHTHFA